MKKFVFCADVGGTYIKSALIPTPSAVISDSNQIDLRITPSRSSSIGVLNHSLPFEIASLIRESCLQQKINQACIDGIRLSITGEVSDCGNYYRGHLRDRGVPEHLAARIADATGCDARNVRIVADSAAWAIGFAVSDTSLRWEGPVGVLCFGTGVGFAIAQSKHYIETAELKDNGYYLDDLFRRAGHGKENWEVHNHLGHVFFDWADRENWDRERITVEFSSRVGLLLTALKRAYPGICHWVVAGGYANYIDPKQVWSDSKCSQDAQLPITQITSRCEGIHHDLFPLIGACAVGSLPKVRRIFPPPINIPTQGPVTPVGTSSQPPGISCKPPLSHPEPEEDYWPWIRLGGLILTVATGNPLPSIFLESAEDIIRPKI